MIRRLIVDDGKLFCSNVAYSVLTGKPAGGSMVLWAVVAALSAGLLVYSQTVAYFGDECFHLVAAQLINAGKRPYLDFFYQHVPLYAYLNAGWFHLVGESWRGAHALSALLTGASVLLVAGFVFARVPEANWRVAVAMTAALMVGLNILVISYGTIGQPYGLCLFLNVVAFRLVIGAVGRERGFLPFCAGLSAGAAAASSLLSAPVAPILLLWMARYNRTGNRLHKSAWFLAGAVIPFLPLLWLAVQAPRETLFNVVEYHLFYRRINPSLIDVIKSDLILLTSWLESAQGVGLALLAAVGILFLAGRNGWDAPRRAEFVLCAWLTGGLMVYLACTLPTWHMYFILTVPFLSILASVGVYAIGSRIWTSGWPGWLLLLVVVLFALGLARQAYHTWPELQSYWPRYEDIAREVNLVTPSDGEVWISDEMPECIYFAASRVPPQGLENSLMENVKLPAALAASLKLVSRSQRDQWLAAGRFETVVVDVDDPRAEAFGLQRLYAGRKRVGDYDIFWSRGIPGREPQ
jgi:hypothetical protein